MIHTLTLNTAIDMNIFCGSLQPSTVNRTQRTEYCPNGKGVNVSLVLNHFRQPTHVMGIFGGFTGRYIVEELKKQKINVTPSWVQAATRINVFINDGSNEYKLVNTGAPIDDECKQQIIQHLDCIRPGDYLVISGSLPPGIESLFYAEVISLCEQRGGEVILDISHPALRQLLELNPLLIKPNDDELKEIFNLKVENVPQVRTAMRTLHQLGARNVLLTLGAKGLYFSNGSDLWFASAPEVELVSSACAGDAALGAFLSQWLNGEDISLALALASATGANVAGSAGLGKLDRIQELLQQVQIVQL
ncbi:1-phosphofructokinase [Cedecea sp. P7760]|uniref:1-phosphofructokinase n=1 Tax=Cedecea sp. P7760 TaxID=2726983 RepID=UPI0015A4A83D|nr:1-phosphofructokinase [Cedecea sp. P7760]